MQDLRTALPVLNSAIDVGTPVLARTPQMNRDLRDVFKELNRLVRQPSTLPALQRLRETFDSARRFSEWFVPAQTVCNYWNYWFTFLPESLSDRDQVGYSFRQALTTAPRGPVGGLTLGPAEIPPVPGETRGPISSYSGIQAPGQRGPEPNPSQDGVFAPEEQPTIHGDPYGPTGQDGDDCQGGQSGYFLGELPIPGQPASHPSVIVKDIPGSRGPTTLYYGEDAIQPDGSVLREFRDTRVPSRQP